MTIKCPKCHHENPDDTIYCGKCTTPLKPSVDIDVTATIEAPKEELTTGSTFAGRYQIIEEIGKGGMGRVYKVQDTRIKEKIALKLIKPEIAKDKKTIERFNNELRLARKIRHKNVCQMFDLGEERGTQFITMEYVSGEDLRSSIRRFGQLPIGKSIAIVNQICEGLTEAHRQGVVHRDLKSNNIMIDNEGNVRIMDFGIARSLEAKGITGAGVMIGTPEYMSPEQVEGKEVDQRSDIYSLGVILYEMVTGRVPFEGDTPFTVGVKQKSEIPPNPKDINSQIPDDLNNVILRCLEKEKENRYQGVGEVRSELENIESGIPTTEKTIPKRKPLTSREITVQFSLKKFFIPAASIIAVVIIGLILWQILPSKKAAPLAPSGKPSLAIMYFQNNTADENLDIWRDGLSRMLIADLSQSKYIRVLPDDRLYGILNQLNLLEVKNYSTDDLREVAAQGRTTHILKGILTRSGDSFRINTTLQESNTMEIIDSAMVEGKGEGSLHTMVDELTRRIKESFKLSEEEIASDYDKDISKITTSSPEAFKYYVEGFKYNSTGDYRRCINNMERVVEIDPGFGLAYNLMGTAYANLGYPSKGREFRKKALEFVDRLSDRERYIIEARFYSDSEKTYSKAIETYNDLLHLYPDDMRGNRMLGYVYSDLEQWDKAIKQFEVNIRNKDEFHGPYTYSAHAYRAKGMYEKAREILGDYLNNFLDNAVVRGGLAWVYLCQGKYDLALIEADKGLSINPNYYPNSRLKGDISHCRGDLLEAEKEYQKLLGEEEQATHLYGRDRLGALYLRQGKFEKSKEQTRYGIELAEKLVDENWKSSFHLYLAYKFLKSRNLEEALKECNEAWNSADKTESLSKQISILHLEGLTYIEMKSINEAQKTANQLKEINEKSINKKLMRYYYHLLAIIELDRENFSKAIEYFNESMSLLSFQNYPAHGQALFFSPLALTHYKAGNLEKAREEYERITSLTVGRLNFGDIYAKSYYMLGKIHEQQGNKANAIEHYEKFLDLWKDADPGLPEVDDARTRLSKMEGRE